MTPKVITTSWWRYLGTHFHSRRRTRGLQRNLRSLEVVTKRRGPLTQRVADTLSPLRLQARNRRTSHPTGRVPREWTRLRREGGPSGGPVRPGRPAPHDQGVSVAVLEAPLPLRPRPVGGVQGLRVRRLPVSTKDVIGDTAVPLLASAPPRPV